MKPYKGYTAKVTFDEDNLTFFGEVLGLQDVITFEAQTAPDLTQAFHDSVDDYLAWCAEDGRAPERPYSGTLSLRTDPDLHRNIAVAAARRSKSVNQWIVEALSDRAAAELGDSAPLG